MQASSPCRNLSPRPAASSQGATLPQELLLIRDQGQEQTVLLLTWFPLQAPLRLHETLHTKN